MRQQQLHPYTAIINKNQKDISKQARDICLNWLANTFPAAFNTTSHIRPLKIGIMKDIFEYADKAAAAGISKSKLRESVVMFTRRVDYLVCLKARNMRIDLQGNPVSVVTEEEAEKASAKIKKRVEKSVCNARKISRDSAPRQKTTQKVNSANNAVQTHHYQHEPLTAYSGQSFTAQPSRQTSVLIKTKTTRKFDPDSVARLKEKLGLSKKLETEEG